MLPIDLDFAPRPKLRAAGIVLLVAAAASTAAIAEWHRRIAADTSALEARKSDLARAVRRAPAAFASDRAAGAGRAQEMRAAHRVIGQMTVPWDALFQQLEAATDRDIALLGVHPDANARQVLISGEAKNLRAILEYTRRLERTGVLRSVVVLGHASKPEGAGRAVRFSLSAAWQPER